MTVLLLCLGAALFAQDAAAARSWYVSGTGNDNDNNGRSEAAAFKTLKRAFEAAQGSNVKTITVAGDITGGNELSGTNKQEILITGKAGPAPKVTDRIRIEGEVTIRFENIVFSKSNNYYQLSIDEKSTVILGRGILFDEESGSLESSGTITMEGDAKVIGSVEVSRGTFVMKDTAVITAVSPRTSGNVVGVALSGGSFSMQGDAEISGINGTGIAVLGQWGNITTKPSLTLQDNAKISGCKGRGVVFNSDGTFVMKDNAVIMENLVLDDNYGKLNYVSGYSSYFGSVIPACGGGVYLRTGSLSMEGNSSITNNRAGDKGGGLYIRAGNVVLKGNVVISGNSAEKGGGIYYEGQTGLIETLVDSNNWTASSTATSNSFVIQGSVTVKDNSAKQGGGIYIEHASISETAIVPKNVTFEQVYENRVKLTSYTMKASGLDMQGGIISGNKAEFGAGVYVEGNLEIDEYKMKPNAGLEDFRVKTGKKLRTCFAFNGGSITGNAAEFVGGGIYIKTAGAYVPGKGTVKENTAGDGEGEDTYTP
jgi:predicted outer membrane repeat protein